MLIPQDPWDRGSRRVAGNVADGSSLSCLLLFLLLFSLSFSRASTSPEVTSYRRASSSPQRNCYGRDTGLYAILFSGLPKETANTSRCFPPSNTG